MYKILLCDHQDLTRNGLAKIILSLQRFDELKYASIDENLVDAIKETNPDLLIIDPYSAPDGLRWLKQTTSIYPDMRLMVFSNNTQRSDILALLNLGIKCYLSKKATAQEMMAGIAAAAIKGRYFCNEVNQQFYMGNPVVSGQDDLPHLSAREKEILHFIADGVSDKNIAERLFLSFHTIRTHRKNINKKLGFNLKNAAELILVINALNDLI